MKSTARLGDTSKVDAVGKIGHREGASFDPVDDQKAFASKVINYRGADPALRRGQRIPILGLAVDGQ